MPKVTAARRARPGRARRRQEADEAFGILHAEAAEGVGEGGYEEGKMGIVSLLTSSSDDKPRVRLGQRSVDFVILIVGVGVLMKLY